LTKATTGTYTLAAPGASNLYKTITVYSTSTGQHVTTVAGCLGGTTMTMAAAIGTSFSLYAVSTAAWSVVSLNGVTQS
jgi:poly(3-hydroxyalkanoate) synthetase